MGDGSTAIGLTIGEMTSGSAATSASAGEPVRLMLKLLRFERNSLEEDRLWVRRDASRVSRAWLVSLWWRLWSAVIGGEVGLHADSS